MRRSIPFPDHPSATTMRLVWAVAMARIAREAIRACDPLDHRCERLEDMRAADAAVAGARRRKEARRTGDWRRR